MSPTTEEHYARRARLGAPIMRVGIVTSPVLTKARQMAADRPMEIVCRVVPASVPLEVTMSCYRLAFDSNPGPDQEIRITLKEIILQVCEKRGVKRNAVLSCRRNQDLVLARHEIMWRAREETLLSLPQIGRGIGGRDHTTVLHGVRRHQERIDAGEVTAP